MLIDVSIKTRWLRLKLKANGRAATERAAPMANMLIYLRICITDENKSPGVKTMSHKASTPIHDTEAICQWLSRVRESGVLYGILTMSRIICGKESNQK